MKFNYKSLSSSLINEFKNKLATSYPNMLAGDDVNTTLFRIDTKNTTYSNDSDTSYEKVGSKSPFRFEKINDYPIYNCTEYLVDTDWSFESGYHPEEVTFDCVLPPFAVQANVGDYLHVEYLNSELLFEIQPAKSESTIDTAEAFRKVKLKLTRYTEDDLFNQTTLEYNFIIETNVLISKDVLNVAEVLKMSYANLVNNLITTKYDYTQRGFTNLNNIEHTFLYNNVSKLFTTANKIVSIPDMTFFRTTPASSLMVYDEDAILTQLDSNFMYLPEFKAQYLYFHKKSVIVMKMLNIDAHINTKKDSLTFVSDLDAMVLDVKDTITLLGLENSVVIDELLPDINTLVDSASDLFSVTIRLLEDGYNYEIPIINALRINGVFNDLSMMNSEHLLYILTVMNTVLDNVNVDVYDITTAFSIASIYKSLENLVDVKLIYRNGRLEI